MTLEITEDTLTSKSSDFGEMASHYRVIGGNARMVVIEGTDAQGYKSIGNIHLVEGGLAIETTDCTNDPEPCERVRRRAMEQLRTKQRPGSDPFREADDGALATMTDAGEPNLAEAPAAGPRLVYFERVSGER